MPRIRLLSCRARAGDVENQAWAGALRAHCVDGARNARPLLDVGDARLGRSMRADGMEAMVTAGVVYRASLLARKAQGKAQMARALPSLSPSPPRAPPQAPA